MIFREEHEGLTRINFAGSIFADTRCAIHRYHQRYFQDAYFHDPSARIMKDSEDISGPASHTLGDPGIPELSRGLHVSHPEAMLPPGMHLGHQLAT